MLKVEHLQAAYGKVQTLWEVGFEVPKGAIVALLGQRRGQDDHAKSPVRAAPAAGRHHHVRRRAY